MSNFPAQIKNICAKLKQCLLASSCAWCLQPSPHSTCAGCLADLPWLNASCPRCALPSPGGQICGDCLRHPPSHQRCRALLSYQTPVQQALLRWKYAQDLRWTKVWHDLWRHGVPLPAPMAADCWIPMPSSSARLKQRGYQPVQLWAQALAHSQGQRCEPLWLQRLGQPRPQEGLSRAERQHNPRNSFIASAQVAGRHVLLLDDVITTGASVEHASRSLLQAGALSVEVWAIARTLPRDS